MHGRLAENTVLDKTLELFRMLGVQSFHEIHHPNAYLAVLARLLAISRPVKRSERNR